MEIGNIITRQELLTQGWTFQQKIMKGSAEIWTKDTSGKTYLQSIIWRVKTQSVYLMWDRIKKGGLN